MNKYLLLSAIAIGIGTAAIADNLTLMKTEPTVKQLHVKGMKRLSREIKTPGFITEPGNLINPEISAPRRAPEMRDGFSLYEDFESWDGTNLSWLPEGWTTDHKNSPESDRGWKMTQPLNIYDIIYSKCLTYELFSDEVDEWVITPEFHIEKGMELRWSTMTSPYFYDWDLIDMTKGEQESFTILNDIKVNISIDGGETWQTIFSHAENLIEETGSNFFSMFNYNVRPFILSLDKFSGNDAMIGFQIEGRDGNTTFLDDVSVGLPPTQTSYTRPLSNLFFGLSEMDMNVPASIMAGPVFQPVKYTNTTPNTKADFTWIYTDSDGADNYSNDKDLYVTYSTDYTSESTTRNNMYPFPVLEGSSSTTSADTFTFPGFYQAGGRGEYKIYYTDTQEEEVIQLGLTIADPITEGTATYADIEVPYFGYNHASDRFWSEFTFGDDYDDNNWNHLEKYGDFFYSPDTPIVIDGIRANAYGKVNRNAVFKAEIYFINGGFGIPEQPAYTAICTGDDITIIDKYSSNDNLSLNFKFDQPVVITKSVTPYFLVAISGFRDPENVEYFSPEMSATTNPNNLGLGWLGKELMFGGTLMPLSWGSVTALTGDDLRVAFYIMLDAEFPWLTAPKDTLEIAPASSASLELNSYYDGSRLNIKGLPDWLTASIEGRYGATTATFRASEDAPTGSSAVLNIEGPGVKKDITISVGTAGIGNFSDYDDMNTETLYTLDGRRIKGQPEHGIYIKVSNGKAKKIII